MATEQAVEQVAEQVAEHLDEAAEVARHVDPMFVKGLFVGAGIGMAVGFFWGWRWNKEKIKAEAYEQSEKEVRAIREAYHSMAENKPSLEAVVEEKGYSPERPTKPPVHVNEPPVVQHPQRRQDASWDYEVEIPKRTKNRPYVIHQDEFNEDSNEYTRLTWTYYAADNILVDENDEVVVRPELTVGEENLKKFGHGSDDENVVFIRNDRIEIEWEVCRTLKSYEVEVMGLGGPEGDVEDDAPT